MITHKCPDIENSLVLGSPHVIWIGHPARLVAIVFEAALSAADMAWEHDASTRVSSNRRNP
jgi:hypothetical protein